MGTRWLLPSGGGVYRGYTCSALLLSLLLSAPPGAAAAARSDDPPVKVWLNQDNFRRGDRARVNAALAEDGYLVVLRADADGRVRVLFPLDPGDDDFEPR